MARATMLLDESVAVYRELGDRKELAVTLIHAGELMRRRGEYEAAAERYTESLMLCHEIGEWRNAVLAQQGLGYVALHTHNDSLAAARFRKSLTLAQAHDSTVGIAASLAGFAGLAGLRRQPQRAARILAGADALLRVLDTHLEGPDVVDYNDILADLRVELDAPSFEARWAEGQAMTLEQVVAYALSRTGSE